MKSLKFADPLPDLVLSGEKDTTWRVEDEKQIDVNDRLELCDSDGESFAEATVEWVKRTTFDRLTVEDREGHEPFASEEEMYETYEQYYGREITADTPLKVIKFRLTAEL